jgi:hypothetical protein
MRFSADPLGWHQQARCELIRFYLSRIARRTTRRSIEDGLIRHILFQVEMDSVASMLEHEVRAFVRDTETLTVRMVVTTNTDVRLSVLRNETSGHSIAEISPYDGETQMPSHVLDRNSWAPSLWDLLQEPLCNSFYLVPSQAALCLRRFAMTLAISAAASLGNFVSSDRRTSSTGLTSVRVVGTRSASSTPRVSAIACSE